MLFQDQPLQSNGYDCGVFASQVCINPDLSIFDYGFFSPLQFALYRVFGKEWDFNEVNKILKLEFHSLQQIIPIQSHMGVIRKLMLEELLTGCLMYTQLYFLVVSLV